MRVCVCDVPMCVDILYYDNDKVFYFWPVQGEDGITEHTGGRGISNGVSIGAAIASFVLMVVAGTIPAVIIIYHRRRRRQQRQRTRYLIRVKSIQCLR